MTSLDPATVEKMRRLMGDRYRTVVDIFIEHTASSLDRMQATSYDAVLLTRHAHMLKAGAAQMGAMELGACFAEIEALAAQGEAAAAAAQLPRAQAAFNRAREDFKALPA